MSGNGPEMTHNPKVAGSNPAPATIEKALVSSVSRENGSRSARAFGVLSNNLSNITRRVHNPTNA